MMMKPSASRPHPQPLSQRERGARNVEYSVVLIFTFLYSIGLDLTQGAC
jgi:hypothetical protein